MIWFSVCFFAGICTYAVTSHTLIHCARIMNDSDDVVLMRMRHSSAIKAKQTEIEHKKNVQFQQFSIDHQPHYYFHLMHQSLKSKYHDYTCITNALLSCTFMPRTGYFYIRSMCVCVFVCQHFIDFLL